MNITYTDNKYICTNIFRTVDQIQKGGSGKDTPLSKKGTRYDAAWIKKLYEHLINGILNIYHKTMNTNINGMKADVFSLMLCLVGSRDGMLYESYYKDIDQIMDFVKETVKIYKLKNIMIKKSKNNLYYLIFDKKYKKLAKDAMDNYNENALGKLLGFTCSLDSIDRIEDYVAQRYYVDESEFYTQLCSVKDYEINKNKIIEQYNEFKRIGSIVSKNVTMENQTILGTRTLIEGVVGSDNKKLLKHREEYIDILRQLAESENDYAVTIRGLETIGEQSSQDHIIKIKIVLFNAVLVMYQLTTGRQISNNVLEKIMYKN